MRGTVLIVQCAPDACMAHLPALHSVRQAAPWTHASYAFQLSNSGIVCLHTLVSPHTACSTGTVYIYDHGSSPPLQGALADHIAAGRVKYAWWDPGNFTSRVTR